MFESIVAPDPSKLRARFRFCLIVGMVFPPALLAAPVLAFAVAAPIAIHAANNAIVSLLALASRGAPH